MRPTFSITIGSLNISTDNPVGGPKGIVIDRDMDVPADAFELCLMERADINLGQAVSIQMGYDGQEQAVFTGNVVSLRPGISGVKIHALGRMNALLNLRLTTVYENTSAGNIAGDIVGQAGLNSGTIDTGPTLPGFTMDSKQSAFYHLKELANRLGYELYADRNGLINFHALGPAQGLDAMAGGITIGAGLPGLSGATGYMFGQHLINARTEQQEAAWGRIQIGGESPMSGQGDATAHWLTTNDSDYRGRAGDDPPELLIRDALARTKDLADRFAAGRLAVATRVAHQVFLTVMGQPQIDLGNEISSSQAPDALINGNGYVRALRHRFGADIGFVTDFRISLRSD